MPLNIEFDSSIFSQLERMSPARIKSIRKKFGFTQANFAEMLGVKYVTYCSWERGVRSPSSPSHALLNIADKHPTVFLENRKEIIVNIMKYFKAVQ